MQSNTRLFRFYSMSSCLTLLAFRLNTKTKGKPTMNGIEPVIGKFSNAKQLIFKLALVGPTVGLS